MNNPRITYYNPSISYLKAIAITLMVFCHSGDNIAIIDRFVYMFHMPLFFIVSGYCFKESYLSLPKTFLKRKLKGIYWPYLKWSLIFLLLHNVFCSLHIDGDPYGNIDIVKRFLHIVFQMREHDQLLGGYWFLCALFFGYIIFWISLKLSRNKPVSVGGVLLVAAITLNAIGHMPYSIITSQIIVAALLIDVGYSLSHYKKKIFGKRVIIIGFALTIVGSFFWNMGLGSDFYDNVRMLPYLFTSVFFTWSLYSLFSSHKLKSVADSVLCFIGDNTLVILTWHMLSFKVVSLFLVFYYHLPISCLSEHPVITEYASHGWWVVYFLFAMLTTCCIASINSRLKVQSSKLKVQ